MNKYLSQHIKSFLIVLTLFLGLTSYGQTYLDNFYEIGKDFVTLGDNSYFFAKSSQGEQGLYKTNGTQKGTILVSSMPVGKYEVGEMTVYNNALYFAAKDSEASVELWKSDGTTSGTQLFKDINPSNHGSSWPSNFITYNGILYFSAIDYYTSGGKRKIFKTDGTPEGTVPADEIVDGDSDFLTPVIAEGKLYFSSGALLFETDGTSAGTRSVTIDGLQYISDLHSFNNNVYFITYNYNKTYIRLYRMTDIDTYVMLKEFSIENYKGLELYGLTAVGERVVFSVVSGETYEDVKDTLWATDGTPEGTAEIMSKGGDNSLWFEPHFSGFIPYNNEIYFSAGPATNSALWKTDGTLQGTKEVIHGAYINRYATMLVLEEKLYFLSGVTLYSYNMITQENSPVWHLTSTRKSTGDDYFIKTDGRYVYAAVRNDRQDDTYTFDFFHTGPNPLIKVSAPWGIRNNETARFESKVDSLAKIEVGIQNLGNSPLAFSKVQVSGEGFYINGEVDVNWYQQEDQSFFPQVIASSKRGKFEVGFLPSSPGVHTGYLILRSNDTSQPEFRIKLYGDASDMPADSLNATFPTNKEIKWDNRESQILLDNSTVFENATSGTIVGSFQVNSNDENFTYRMIEGQGSEDNAIFDITGDQLTINNAFQADIKKSYTIRVRATGNSGVEIESNFVIGVDEESIEVTLGDCDLVASPLTNDLYTVQFINEVEAIAVGGSVVLKTEDKGETWRQINVFERSNLGQYKEPAPAGLSQVQFVSETIGFIVGTYSIFRTEDGGLSWRPLDFDGFSQYGVQKFHAINSEILFVISKNKIFNSTDGGFTWRESYSIGGYDFRAFYFYDSLLGFSSENRAGYSITNDGGKTWTHYDLNVQGAGNEQITDYSFVNSNSGFASTRSGKVIKTIDGGITWTVINSEYRDPIKQIIFFDDNHGYIVGGSISETIDGGVTWNLVDLSICASMNKISQNRLGDLIAVGGGCYSGQGRTIYTAALGGQWTEVSSIIGSRDIGNITFKGQEGYLFSKSQSRKSLDGGITWGKMVTPIDKEVLKAEMIGDALLIKGYTGQFYKSTDRGLNWSLLNGGAQYLDFDIIDQNTIIAGTYEGGIAKSTDAGDSWTIVSGASSNHKTLLEFVDKNIGYAKSYPDMARTQDGGATWQEIIIDSTKSNYLYAIKFIDAQNGIVSTSNGYYKTTDSGDSWTKLSLNVSHTSKIIVSNQQDWYISSDRYIYQSLDNGNNWVKYFTANRPIKELEMVDDTIYFSDDDGAIYKLSNELMPLNAGYIRGDKNIRVGDEEIYTVLKNSDNRYTWEVEGNNNLVYEDTFARITWNSPGNYRVLVNPYGSCRTGIPAEITVNVYEQMAPPEIIGPLEVLENSKGIEYSTPLDEQASYIWSVTGQRSFQVAGNILMVDWGTIGLQEIGLIKTDLISGQRVYNSIEVNVVPLDPFTILQSDATCRGMANGRLQIKSRLVGGNFVATLTGTGNSSQQTFTDEILFDGLSTGVYDLCIAEVDTTKNYCYQFLISEPEPFEVSSKMGSISSKE